MPLGKGARLMNGLSSDFLADPNPEIANMLNKKGYVAAAGGASVADFKSLEGQSLAVLHVRTHGGAGGLLDDKGNLVLAVDPTTGKEIPNTYIHDFGLWTTDVADAATIARYKDDVVAGRLVRMYEVVYPCIFSFCTQREYHLGVTQLFVDKYWTGAFASNAYVHMSVCSGGGAPSPVPGGKSSSQQFVESVRATMGNMAYVGWDQPAVVADMDRAARYLVDRLTGANLLDTPADPKEDPPQRPFDLESVVAAMQGRGMTVSNAKPGPSKLVYSHPEPSNYVLAPSIASVASGGGKLGVTGILGTSDSTNAKITVGGADCAIDAATWAPKRTECAIKDDASGEVILTVNDHESNRVKLSSWKGNLTYTFLSSPANLSAVLKLGLHLRGDIHDYRDKPGQKPAQHQKQLEIVADTRADLSTTGEAVVDKDKAVWTGTKSLRIIKDKPAGDDWCWGAGIVDKADQGHLWFELIASTKTSANHEAVYYLNPQTGLWELVKEADIAFALPHVEIRADHSAIAGLQRLKDPATISPTGAIAARTITVDGMPKMITGKYGPVDLQWVQQVEWDSMTPEPNTAPDPAKDEQ
jgi:hypothetical protein